MLHAGYLDPLCRVRVVACGPLNALGVPAWIVIDKPPGMQSVPGKNPGRLDAATWFRERAPALQGPITVHRLDQETSGLLLMAGDAHSQRQLSMQFEKREVKKAYRAIVRGEPPADHLTIQAPLRPDYTRRPRQVIDWQSGKRAISHYRLLHRNTHGPGLHDVELEPVTGRTHQLRIHCAYLGTPILGDSLYGQPDPRGLQLKATSLEFICPVTGNHVRAMTNET
jgi:tRNA pseudouridine32 synthase / 23S rRNA pseudouridine746 synthase